MDSNSTSVIPSLQLKAFGGLALSRAGAPAEAAFGQRRPLAVMAMLAAAGAAGVSRDKLIATLWPDSDAERGRKALAQSLYALRKAAADADMFEGVADVRLNRDSIFVDTIAFDEAVRNGRLDEAASLYSGPFCDGFAVPGAVEFDRWLDAERSSYAARCADVLKRLIENARRDGQLDKEIAWARQLVAIDLLDSASTLALIDALAKSGDVAGALRCARAHEAIVHDQLEMPVSSTIRKRLDELEARKIALVSERPTARTQSATRPKIDEPSPTASPATVSTASGPARKGWSRVSGRRTAITFVAGLVLLAATVKILRMQHTVATAQAAPPMSPDAIAILPFAVQSDDRRLQFLGEGSADLMARMLTGTDGPRAIEPGAVLAVLDSLPSPPPGASRQNIDSHARVVSGRLGAGAVVVGRVSGTTSAVSLKATVLDVATGDTRASAEVVGPADSISSLVDALATRLVAQTTIGADRASAFFNARLALLRPYLRAEAAFHADRYKEAAVLYQQALAQDSTFAPAALGLALAADRLNSAEQHERGMALAWAAREKLSERDRSYLVALAGPRYPEPSTVGEQLTAWENVVALNPDRSSAWLEFGERLLYDGSLLGIAGSDERAAAAFRRALDLDPADQRGKRELVQIAMKNGNLPEMEQLLRTSDPTTVGGNLAGYLTWRVALARNDVARLAEIRRRFPSLDETNLRTIAMASQHDIAGLHDGARALRFLAARAALGSDQLDVLLAEHSLALNEGQARLALELTDKIGDAIPGSRAHLRLRILDFLYADGDSAAARRAETDLELATARSRPGENNANVRLADLCVLAQWKAAPWRKSPGLSATESQHLARWIREMRETTMLSTTVPVGASPLACSEIVEAMLAVRSRAADARDRVVKLDEAMLSGPALGDATAWATMATSRLYAILGDKRRALAVVQQRPYMKGWPRYLATSLRDEADLATAVGDDRARRLALQRFEAFKAAETH